jgi:hypothetical protein
MRRAQISKFPESKNDNKLKDRSENEPCRFDSIIYVRRCDIILRIVAAFIVGIVIGAMFFDFLSRHFYLGR